MEGAARLNVLDPPAPARQEPIIPPLSHTFTLDMLHATVNPHNQRNGRI
jgi:hypothetical protein